MKRQKGFTLIELLVVVAIIGILVFVTSSSFVNSQQRSRDASRKSELKGLSDALNMYYADKGFFPEANYLNTLISSEGEFSDELANEDKIIYMKKVPKGNASGVEVMYYETSSARNSFRLFTNLENDEDKDCLDREICTNLGYEVSEGCCYVITSSNIGVTESL